jgi:hypothetical protein
MKIFIAAFFCLLFSKTFSQDTTIKFEEKYVTMPTAVIRSNLNPQAFIKYVMHDTSFYKAFKNIKIVGFSALNDIKILDKKSAIKASLYSKTKQQRKNNCRKTEIINETTTGDFYNDQKAYNYYNVCQYRNV